MSDQPLLIDTNSLTEIGRLDPSRHGRLFISSVALLEVLGMQRPDLENNYRYALPIIGDLLMSMPPPLRRLIAGSEPLEFVEPPSELFGTLPLVHSLHLPFELKRLISDHAIKRPVPRTADVLSSPPCKLRPPGREVGHRSASIALELGDDWLFETHAAAGLNGRTLRPVKRKWSLLREHSPTILPVDEGIMSTAATLANLFIDDGFTVKTTIRNTWNDILVAATAQAYGLSLRSTDGQLNEFYKRHGWQQASGSDRTILTPPSIMGVSSDPDVKKVSLVRDQYVNQPRALRRRRASPSDVNPNLP